MSVANPSGKQSLVMLGRYPGKDRAVAQALARCFGRDDTWGIQIVGATPIVLLDELSIDQAASLKAALVEVEEAGSRFDIQQGTDSTLPRLQWPTPPRVNGKAVSEYPIDPALLPKPKEVTKTAAPKEPTTGHTVLTIPCPYTGQLMRLEISVTISRTSSGTGVAIAASARPGSTRINLAALPAHGSGSLPRPPTGSFKLPETTSSEPVIHGLEALNDLTLQAAPRSQASVPTVRVQVPEGAAVPKPVTVPLEVPLPSGAPAPMPIDARPVMDLRAFEASVASSLKTGENGAKCSVVIDSNANAIIHQFVAELRNITEKEAAKLCAEPQVTLAERISMDEATALQERFANLNVVARIVKQ